MEILEPNQEEKLDIIERNFYAEVINKKKTENIADYIVSTERINQLLDAFVDMGGLAVRHAD